jgi:hypothetical protein
MLQTDAASRSERVSATALGWLLLPPAAVAASLLVLVLAPSLGDLAFPRPPITYWAEITPVRKPAVQAGYLLMVACAIAYAAAIGVVARRGLRLPGGVCRTAVIAVQVLGAGLIVACWLAQPHAEGSGSTRTYFTTATLVVAALLTALAAAALEHARRSRARDAAPRGGGRTLAASRPLAGACVVVAVLATAAAALSAVYTDSGLFAAPEALFLGAWFMDESSAVLNGRSPLVNMVAYGNLWPYATAVPLQLLGDTYAVFTATMATLTGVALLAVFGVLLRVTRSAPFALALFLPVLAMSFFIQTGTSVARYSPGNYYGMFPLRYAGPCLLALLTAVYVGRDERRGRTTVALFATAGLVALNNVDFGGAALLGTAAAILATRPAYDKRTLGRLCAFAALGLVTALALVSLLTLVRAGSLPQLGLLSRYGRIFVIGGNGNLPLPALGLHVVITLTFVATLATAGVRVAARERNRVLTAMLAWTGLFGLGASMYYYAYRSHPDVLIDFFALWALALALLVVVVHEAVAVQGRRLSLPAVVVLFGFALAACSIPQLPSPWAQLRRIEGRLEPGQLSYIPANAFRAPYVTQAVSEQTRPGERVLVLSPTGHRVADDAGVVNVSPYPGLGQMPTRDQLHESLRMLEAEGGSKVFISDRVPAELDADIRAQGYRGVGSWLVDHGWPSDVVTEYQR